ncbi:hypothetical protein [Zeaxanthinibacter enoshimensis]|uniref:Uncharacterized protein n=1 Tax=Zeaxanthinibacter enoshimensis TaxID=392009 RepID=A0A4R6TRS3_9FLAO|nr:hypothetical protein [Zeaxanthinibacter enoshimensis]TDQ32579.1 hypothetical protein CLV82_0412 [Zeaxanthinibacter enoshimensis]
MGRKELNFLELLALLKERIGPPANLMVVLATLESYGFQDEDAQQKYGYRSLYALADSLFDDLTIRKTEDSESLKRDLSKKDKLSLYPVSDYMWVKTNLFLKHYPRGLFYLLPIFLQVAAIVVFGYSLWAYLSFNIIQSTAVVLGVILGLVISGGFIQVIGHQASFYWHNEEFAKTERVIWQLLKTAFFGYLCCFLIIGLINFIFSFYPTYFVGVVSMYSILIGILLLICAPFHTIEKRWVISLIISLATLFAIILKLYTDLHIYLTHWLGISSGIIAGLVILQFFFKHKKKSKVQKDSFVNPQMIVAKNYRLFVYGTLLYILIFTDRILAWSADTGITHDYLLLYEKQYEIGMDLAIIIFFLLAGVMEYAVASFCRFMNRGQEVTKMKDITAYNAQFIGIYKEHLIWLFITAIAAAWVVFLLIDRPWGYYAVFGEPLPSMSLWVCILGGVGYFFLAWGMLNAQYLFTLKQHSAPLKVLILAVLVNFITGIAFSRFISFEYSVLGMLLGAMIFAAGTYLQCMKFFKTLDYYYYAAY